MNRRYRQIIDEPTMSDKTLLLTVEDLISTAFGSLSKNTVNFKLIQTILHILARQLRLLEQDVEIKFDEIGINFREVVEDDEYDAEPTYTSSSSGRAGEGKETGKGAERGRGREGRDRDKKDEKKEKKDRDDKGEKKDRGKKERAEKGETGTKKERGEKDEKKDKKGFGKDEKEDGGHGKSSSKDRDKKEGSRDVDGKDKRAGSADKKKGKKGEERGADAGGPHHRGARGKSADREGSRTSITVTEAERKGAEGTGSSDKILIAERGPGASRRVARVGSIEVVTASQFALLEEAVKQLQQVSGPVPMPALPDNEQLRKDLAQGRASLSETMQAVQLNARVQAAEQGLARMAGLLTQLAAAGVLPMEMAGSIEALQAELRQAATAAGFGGTVPEFDHLGIGADVKPSGFGVEFGFDGGSQSRSRRQTTAELAAARSRKFTGAGPIEPELKAQKVTHVEMQNFLDFMKEELNKEISNLTGRADHSADMASKTSRSVAEKLAVALQIDARITSLFSQTDDYAEQLSGFDTGLTTQMASFQEQMMLMKAGLGEGLALLETANNNAETAAVLDLTERYEGLVLELDNTLHLHKHLTTLQKQLSDELRSLVKCVEMLREQKADRDEVLDGLRDKADISRLAGLLYEKDFAQARLEIEKRLDKCYDKFHKQDLVWQNALRELTLVSDSKAELIMLLALKEATNDELNGIQKLLRKLEIMLGEPKAALLMRKLAKNAACGACLTRAIMPLSDATHGLPQALPALRGALQLEDPCLADLKLRPPDNRDHICHRWAGGSHTLMAGNIVRVKAGETDLETIPTKKFEGYGIDGRLYMMEEDMLPCAECNQLSTDKPEPAPAPEAAPAGGGDQA